MIKNNIKINIFKVITGVVLLITQTLLFDYVLSLNNLFYFGKDSGLIFRVLTLCLFGGLFFILIKKIEINSFFIGLAFGFLSYILVFGYYIFMGIITGGSNNYPIMSSFGDHLLATLILLISSLFFVFFKK